MCATNDETAPVLQIYKTKDLSLREVFPHEARDFTVWLSEHLEWLAEALVMDGLRLEGTEVPSGRFWTDILARRPDGSLVVIENQFGRLDHDHLGKAHVYAAVHRATTIVWIAESFDEEARAAIAYKNEVGECDYYAVQMQAHRIEEKVTVRFTVVVRPRQPRRRLKEGKIDIKTIVPTLRIEKKRTLEERCAYGGNGKRRYGPGTERYQTFLLYKDGMTVKEFLDKGGELKHLHRDAEYGHVRLYPAEENADDRKVAADQLSPCAAGVHDSGAPEPGPSPAGGEV